MPLAGISATRNRDAFVEQLLASVRRERYFQSFVGRSQGVLRTDPNSNNFHPFKAAAFYKKHGDIEEAIWLTFLGVHFGEHIQDKWLLCSQVYGNIGGRIWKWDTISRSLSEFRQELDNSQHHLTGKFGNHRKYESKAALDPLNGIGATFSSYIHWIGDGLSQQNRLEEILNCSVGSKVSAFDLLYEAFQVRRFGRLAKFEFLCMLNHLGLIDAAPGHLYLNGATGPARGASRLMFDQPNRGLGDREIRYLSDIREKLEISAQVFEDALCNWDKSPSHFIHFRG